MIKIHLNIWLGRPEYCNFLAPPACKLTLPIKGPSLLRITLPSPDLKPEYPFQCGHTSAATAAKNLLSGEIIDILTFWSLIDNELCMSPLPNSNWLKCGFHLKYTFVWTFTKPFYRQYLKRLVFIPFLIINDFSSIFNYFYS